MTSAAATKITSTINNTTDNPTTSSTAINSNITQCLFDPSIFPFLTSAHQTAMTAAKATIQSTVSLQQQLSTTYMVYDNPPATSRLSRQFCDDLQSKLNKAGGFDDNNNNNNDNNNNNQKNNNNNIQNDKTDKFYGQSGFISPQQQPNRQKGQFQTPTKTGTIDHKTTASTTASTFSRMAA